MHIVGDDEASDATFGEGDAHGTIDKMAHLHRRGASLYIVACDVLEERVQIDFLLEVSSKRRAHRLADDGQNRLMIQLRVVEPVQKMDRARPRRGEANAYFAGEFGMRRGHEGGLFFMSRLDKGEAILSAFKRAQNAVNPVTRIAVDPGSAPIRQTGKHEVGDGIGHGVLLNRFCNRLSPICVPARVRAWVAAHRPPETRMPVRKF